MNIQELEHSILQLPPNANAAIYIGSPLACITIMARLINSLIIINPISVSFYPVPTIRVDNLALYFFTNEDNLNVNSINGRSNERLLFTSFSHIIMFDENRDAYKALYVRLSR